MTRCRNVWGVLLAVWSIAILVLLLLPGSCFESEKPKLINIPHFDKVVHFVLFGVFCFLLFLFLKVKKNWSKLRLCTFCLAVTLAYGLLGEVLQFMTNRFFGRTFSWTDLVADGLGAVCTLLVLSLKNRVLARKIKTLSH